MLSKIQPLLVGLFRRSCLGRCVHPAQGFCAQLYRGVPSDRCWISGETAHAVLLGWCHERAVSRGPASHATVQGMPTRAPCSRCWISDEMAPAVAWRSPQGTDTAIAADARHLYLLLHL